MVCCSLRTPSRSPHIVHAGNRLKTTEGELDEITTSINGSPFGSPWYVDAAS